MQKTIIRIAALAAFTCSLSACVATYDDPYHNNGRYNRHDDNGYHDHDGWNDRYEHCPPGQRKKGRC
jgi:hypothetical protein